MISLQYTENETLTYQKKAQGNRDSTLHFWSPELRVYPTQLRDKTHSDLYQHALNYCPETDPYVLGQPERITVG